MTTEKHIINIINDIDRIFLKVNAEDIKKVLLIINNKYKVGIE
jgi:hypothetical protein